MTTPLTTPIAVPATGMNVSAAARAVAAKAPANFVELSGADLQALLNFQKALPTSKGRKLLKGEEEEDFATGNGTATDSPEWVVAQGEVTPVVLDAVGGAPAFAPAGAGAGAGAVAAPVVSAAAFLPGVLLINPGSDVNNRPTLSRDPVKLTLDVNAANNDPTSDPQWRAADPDRNTVFYFFQLKEGERVNDPDVYTLDGKRLSAVSVDGNFKIDPTTGQISRIVSNDQDEPVLFCEDEAELQVVVTDGALVSLPVTVVIDRTLPEFDIEKFDSNYAVFDFIYEKTITVDEEPVLLSSLLDVVVEEPPQFDKDNNPIFDIRKFEIEIDEGVTRVNKRSDLVNDTDVIRQIDKLNLDFASSTYIKDTADELDDVDRNDYLNSFKNITSLDFSRAVAGTEGVDQALTDDLNAEIYFESANPKIELEITIKNQFAGNVVVAGDVPENDFLMIEPSKVEYVEFGAGMNYKGYALHVVDEKATPGTPDEGGVYHLTTEYADGAFVLEKSNYQTSAVVDRALLATECNDLLADAYEDIPGATGDLLAGLGGNDLIFSHGSGDTLIGGAGDDLLVIDGDATIVLSSVDNGLDTVVGFGEDSVIDLGMATVNYLDAYDIKEFFTEEGVTQDSFDAFIAALLKSDVVEFDQEIIALLQGFGKDNLEATQAFMTAIDGLMVVNIEETEAGTSAHLALVGQSGSELAHFDGVSDFTMDNFLNAQKVSLSAVLPV